MKRQQLKKLVEQMVRAALAESSGLDSQAAFDRLQELKEYKTLFYFIKKLGMKPVEEILELKDESTKYGEFYKKVGPGDLDRSTGLHKKTNQFSLQPWHTKMFWDLDIGVMEAAKLFDEYQELNDRFEYKSATSATDAAYGRKRTVVIDKLTGDTVSSTTDRKGSLGT